MSSFLSLAIALLLCCAALAAFARYIEIHRKCSKRVIRLWIQYCLQDAVFFLCAGWIAAVADWSGSWILQGFILVTFAAAYFLILCDHRLFVDTGTGVDYYLLKRARENIADIKLVFFSIPGKLTLLLVVAIACLGVPVAVLAILLKEAIEPAGTTLVVLAIATIAIVIAGLAQPKAGNPEFRDFKFNALVLLARDLFLDLRSRQDNGEALQHQAPPPQPNIIADTRREALAKNGILIVAESARNFSHLPAGSMRFLEGLAQKGAHSPNFFGVVPHTTDSMIPILAGRYPFVGQRGIPAHTGLPRALENREVSTAFFCPADLAFENKGSLAKQLGFSTIFGAAELDALMATGRQSYLGYNDEDMIEPICKWIKERMEEDERFFVTALTLTSHHPYSVPASFAADWGDAHTLKDKYLRSLAYTDRFIEKLFDRLRDSGALKDCLVMVIGDHGQAFREHGRVFHSAALWDTTIRVPCVMWSENPAFPQAEIQGQRSQLDVPATFLDVMGFPPLDGSLGTSLLAPAPEQRELFHATWLDRQSLSVRNGSNKFLHHYGKQRNEFYDLQNDPYETCNLIDQLHADQIRKLEDACLAWREKVNYENG